MSKNKDAWYLRETGDHFGNITYEKHPDYTRPIVEDFVQAPGPGEKGLAIVMGCDAYSTVQGRGIQWVPDGIPSFDTLDDAYEKPLGEGPIALTNPGFTAEQFGIASVLDLRLHGYPFTRRFGASVVSAAIDGRVNSQLAGFRKEWEQSHSSWLGDTRGTHPTAVRDAVAAIQQNLLGEGYSMYLEMCRQRALEQAYAIGEKQTRL